MPKLYYHQYIGLGILLMWFHESILSILDESEDEISNKNIKYGGA